jgi:hypothetical protein
MSEQQPDPGAHQPGDKVRVRSGSHRGARGILRRAAAELLEVELSPGDVIQVALGEIMNYSRVARQAWRTKPKRAGRPRLPVPRKKMVSLRLNLEVLELLAQAAALGLIPNREAAINEWLKQRLTELIGSSLKRSTVD